MQSNKGPKTIFTLQEVRDALGKICMHLWEKERVPYEFYLGGKGALFLYRNGDSPATTISAGDIAIVCRDAVSRARFFCAHLDVAQELNYKQSWIEIQTCHSGETSGLINDSEMQNCVLFKHFGVTIYAADWKYDFIMRVCQFRWVDEQLSEHERYIDMSDAIFVLGLLLDRKTAVMKKEAETNKTLARLGKKVYPLTRTDLMLTYDPMFPRATGIIGFCPDNLDNALRSIAAAFSYQERRRQAFDDGFFLYNRDPVYGDHDTFVDMNEWSERVGQGEEIGPGLDFGDLHF